MAWPLRKESAAPRTGESRHRFQDSPARPFIWDGDQTLHSTQFMARFLDEHLKDQDSVSVPTLSDTCHFKKRGWRETLRCIGMARPKPNKKELCEADTQRVETFLPRGLMWRPKENQIPTLSHSLIIFYNTLTTNLNTHLDFESSFESAGKEASEWTNQRCKCGKSNAVYLERVHAHWFLKRLKKKKKKGEGLELTVWEMYLSMPPKLRTVI